MNKLDREEREILEVFKSGNVTRSKDARINIRLASKDLRGLQSKALAEGIPYQVLIASILHKYVEGQLHEKGS